MSDNTDDTDDAADRAGGVDAGAALPRWWRFVVLGCCMLARVLKSFGQGNTLFLVLPGLRASAGLSRSALSLLFSVACVIAAAAQPLFGRLLDAHGGRVCLPAALVALAASLAALSVATRPAAVFGAIVGLRAFGLGALDTFSTGTLCAWFVRTRAAALGALQLAYFSGTSPALRSSH